MYMYDKEIMKKFTLVNVYTNTCMYNVYYSFFIDHKNKATTWIDPRPDYYAKQPKDHPPPNPKPSSHGEPVFGFRGSGTAAKKVCTCMKCNIQARFKQINWKINLTFLSIQFNNLSFLDKTFTYKCEVTTDKLF